MPTRIAAPDCFDPVEQHFFGLELRRRRDPQLEVEALGGVHPGGQHVVGVAGPGHGAAADRAAMLLEGHHVGHHLAGMRAPRQAVDHRHGGVLAPAPSALVIERADHDGVDVARQHARGVGDGLAAAELHLLAGQHDRLAAELAHADVERHARARRRLVEDHRQRLAGERLRRGAAARCVFMARLVVDDAAQLAGRDVDRDRGNGGGRCCSPGRSLLARAPAGARSIGGAGAVDPRDRLGDLGLADDQRRQQAHDIVAGADGQQLLGAQRVDQLAVRHLALAARSAALRRAPRRSPSGCRSLISASRCLNSSAMSRT